MAGIAIVVLLSRSHVHGPHSGLILTCKRGVAQVAPEQCVIVQHGIEDNRWIRRISVMIYALAIAKKTYIRSAKICISLTRSVYP